MNPLPASAAGADGARLNRTRSNVVSAHAGEQRVLCVIRIAFEGGDGPVPAKGSGAVAVLHVFRAR